MKPSRCILLASPRLNSKLCLLSSSTGLPKSPCVLVEEKIGCLQRVWGDGKHCTGDRETRVPKACVTLSKTLDRLCLILPSFKMCAFPPATPVSEIKWQLSFTLSHNPVESGFHSHHLSGPLSKFLCPVSLNKDNYFHLPL